MKVIYEGLIRRRNGTVAERFELTGTLEEFKRLASWARPQGDLAQQLRPILEAQNAIGDLENPGRSQLQWIYDKARAINDQEIVVAARRRLTSTPVSAAWGIRSLTVCVELVRGEYLEFLAYKLPNYGLWDGYASVKDLVEKLEAAVEAGTTEEPEVE